MAYIKNSLRSLFCIAALLGTGVPEISNAGVNFPGIVPGVPGYVIDYWELDYPWYATLTKDAEMSTPANRFIADPEVVRLPSGWLLAGHDWGGDDGPNRTQIFRSTNGGATWTALPSQSDFHAGSLFIHNNVPFYVGEDSSGKPVVMISTDNGTSWTRSATFSGLTSGTSTPANPVVFNNRIWTSGGQTANLSVSTTANLLLESSWWARGTACYLPKSEWLCGDVTIGESQIVASPNLGVFILPKVKQYPYTTINRINPTTGTAQFDPINGFASLPGGEKKFGAAYDSVSGKFIILSNPILPSDRDSSSDMATDMIRNTAALLTSKDLLHWDVERVFIYAGDERREGYGYLNFDFDGNDIIAVARTAAKIDGEKFPNEGRAHDSNCFTFHRIEDFRTIQADHVVQIFDGNVRIYERTPDSWAMPMGDFALGAFSGLTADAEALGVASGGNDIYLKRSAASGGHIFHFDAFGNFLEDVGTSAPVPVSTTAVLSRRPSGECSWSKTGSGDWAEPENWFYWGRADTDDEIAVFGTAITSSSTINVPSVQQWWQFNTPGDMEGWTVANASDATVSGGTLHGTANSSTAKPNIMRSDCFFYGADVPTVAVRMQAPQNCDVYLLWGDTINISPNLYVGATYTGNGAYQTVQFNMEGVSGWEDKAIATLRIDPRVHTNATRTFSIDWVSLPKAAVRIKGMRFNHQNSSCSYTIGGSGLIALDADSGNSSLEAVRGSHTISTAINLKDNTDVTLASGTTLSLTGNINLYGRTMNVSGAGQLKLGGGIVFLSGGTLSTTGQKPIYINSGISGSLNGTLQFSPTSLNSSVGSSYDLFDNTAALGSMRFTSLSLPSLPAGRYWNTNSLYTSGVITVAAEQRSLTVSSAHGSPSPSVGTHSYTYGSSVSVQMTDPIIANSDAYKYVCTGWTGTGSAPASGSGTNTGSFTLTQNSTVTWLWTTYYYLGVSATTGGSVNQSSGWRSAGSTVTLTATPSSGYTFAGWSGETSGNTNSTSMTVTMTETLYVTANFAPIPTYNLTVTSAHGTPSPSAGTHSYTSGTSLSASVNTPVVSGTTRYGCTGWTGTGNVPSSGSSANTGSFTLTVNSSITWNWAVSDYWLNTEATAGGSVDIGDGWQNTGANITITATASDGYYFTGWTGDVSGDPDNPQMTLTMNQARAVTATFVQYEKNPLPYVQTFETLPPRESILDATGWYSASDETVATVISQSYEWSDVYYPAGTAVHTKVLSYTNADLSVLLETNTAPTDTTVDFMFYNAPHDSGFNVILIGGVQTVLYIDTNGHLNAWYGIDGTETNNAWQVYTNTFINTSEWVRLTCEFDYTTYAQYGASLFRVLLNGIALQPGSGAYSRSESYYAPDPAGEWMLTAGPAVGAITSLQFLGNGMLDDLVVTTNTVTDFIRPARNPLPYAETFEILQTGSSILVEGQTNGWHSTTNTTIATITSLSYSWSGLYHPVESAAHTKVLSCSGSDLSVRLQTPDVATDTTVDFMLSGLIRGTAPNSEIIKDSQSAFFVDMNGHLNAWHGIDGSETNSTWQVYTNTSINTSEWFRLTYEFDYTTYAQYGVSFFRILLNGVALQPGSEAYTHSGNYYTPDPEGEWLLTASLGKKGVESLTFKGNCMLDDLVVTTNTVSDFFKLYTITASAGANGSVSPLSTNVAAGGSATFTVTADNYYRIASLTTNGASAGDSFNNDSTASNFTWSNVQANGSLAATFTEQMTDTPVSTPYPWLAHHGLTNFNADAAADADGDGLLSWQEYIAGTDPTNTASAFRISSATAGPQGGNVIRWNSVAGRLYSLSRCTNLLEGFTAVPGAADIVATPPENVYTNQQDDPSVFYRINVRQAD